MDKNPEPFISIVIPVYNRQDLIDESIQSALNQTYDNYEIIIYDNCSTDNTWESVRRYKNSSNKIHSFKQDKNVGPVRNWYSAISEAKGEYVKILFSDDLMYPDFLKRTAINFSKDTAFVLTSFDMGPNQIQKIKRNDWPKVNGLIESEVYLEGALRKFAFCVSPGAALFRKQDLIETFEEEIPSPSLSDFKSHGAGPDLLLFLKIANKYPYVYKVDDSLVLFRSHEDSQTFKMNNSKKRIIQSCYMQSRVYFSEKYKPQLFGRTLGKALFVELLQNKRISALFLPNLTDLYTLDKNFSYKELILGFLTAILDAVIELTKRFFNKEI